MAMLRSNKADPMVCVAIAGVEAGVASGRGLMRAWVIVGLVGAVANGLALASPVAAATAIADADMTLGIKLSTSGGVFDVNRGRFETSISKSGYGNHFEAADAMVGFTGLTWTTELFAYSSAHSPPESLSVIDAGLTEASLRQDFVFSAENISVSVQQLTLTLWADIFLTVTASGRTAYAGARGNYSINVFASDEELPQYSFFPENQIGIAISSEEKLAVSLPYTHENRYDILVPAGERYYVTVRAANVHTDAYAVPEPQSWTLLALGLLILSFSSAGDAVRRKRRLRVRDFGSSA